MKKTQAAVLQSDGSTPLVEVPLPERGPGDLLVRLRACGVCTGEAMQWYVKTKKSSVLGHEIVAEVINGGEEHGLKTGDRIFPHHHAPCGTCEACMAGYETSCESWKKSSLVPGGYAREFIVPSWNARYDTSKIPETLSDEAAIFIEPVACVVRALHRAMGTRPDSDIGLSFPDGGRVFRRIALVGLGFMGQLSALLLRRRFPDAKITATDFLSKRREEGLELGLKSVLDAADPDLRNSISRELDGEADLVFVCPSSVRAIEQGLDLAGHGAKVLLFAPTPVGQKTNVDFNRLYFREVEIASSYSCGPGDVTEAILWCQSLAPLLESMISHRLSLSDVGEALKHIGEQDPLWRKAIIVP